MRKNSTNTIGVALTIIILVILITFTNDSTKEITFVEKFSNIIVMPIQNGITFLKNKFLNNTTFFDNLEVLKSQNDELLAKNSELETQLRELEIIKSENKILKEAMALTEKYPEYATVPSEIINKDFENYSDVFIINSGEKDGVKKDMAVISEQGLVGRIISTTDTTSKVLPIIDPSSSVSSKTSTTRDSVICKGNIESNNELKLQYIPTDTNISSQDSVETSGMGGIYPRGITIGTITEIVNPGNKLEEYAIVKPAVNFDKLETVLVIISE